MDVLLHLLRDFLTISNSKPPCFTRLTDLCSMPRSSSGAVIMSVVYGYDVNPHGDPFIEIAEATIANFTTGLTPGNFLVNVLPLLQLVPSWFPGSSFKSFANETKAMSERMLRGPIDDLRKRMVRNLCASGRCAHALYSCQAMLVPVSRPSSLKPTSQATSYKTSSRCVELHIQVWNRNYF